MDRNGFMANRTLVPDRRGLMAMIGGLAVSSVICRSGHSEERQSLKLKAAPATILLGSGQAPTRIWGLDAKTPSRFKQGELEFTFQNGLPTPAILDWRGLDGAPSAEPLLLNPPTAAGAEVHFVMPLRRPGTLFCDLKLSPQAQPSQLVPIIVDEPEPPLVDQDEVTLL